MKKTMIMISLVLASISLSTLATTATTFNPQQKEQIKSIVHQYLVSNPQILLEVSAALQKEQQEQAQAIAIKAINKNKKSIFDNTADPVYGNPKGNVTVVEFYDYQCGHCKRMTTIIDQIVTDNKNVKVISKNFPIFGANSVYAAKASIAAYQLNKANFLNFHKELMAKADPLDKATVDQIAEQNGYNIKDLDKIVNQPASDDQIKNNMKLAQDMRLSGTPAFVIANKGLTKFLFVPGAASEAQIQEMINSLQ